jgi:hypothetical protein
MWQGVRFFGYAKFVQLTPINLYITDAAASCDQQIQISGIKIFG